jgi:hypothetical protein
VLLSSCSNKFQQFVNQAQAKLALQRLGLLLAAVASLSGPRACATFVGQCVGMIAGGEGGQHHVSAEAGKHTSCGNTLESRRCEPLLSSWAAAGSAS